MSKRDAEIVPLLLGTDLNAYSMAKAFYDAFGVKSYAMGRYRGGLTEFSRIVKIEFCSGCKDEDVFLPELFSFAKRHKGKQLILVPCADAYVWLIAKNAAALSNFYKFIVPNEELILRLTDKDKFSKIAKEYGFFCPKTIVFEKFNATKALKEVSYPATLKPSAGIEYWRYPFPGMKKIYYPENEDEAFSISEKIYSSGYCGSLLIQERIQNPEIYTYNVFITDGGYCDFGVFGRAVLKDSLNPSCENHAAIITVPENELCEKIKSFLRSVNYKGFANIDLIKANGEFYVLGLNAQQGRCCDYILGSGINIAKRLVLAINGETEEIPQGYKRVLWCFPGKGAADRYVDSYIKNTGMKGLLKKKNCSSALFYSPDFHLNPIRFIYVLIYCNRMNKLFEKYF